MIYTLTLNPSIDYLMKCDHFEMYKTNRGTNEQFRVGGKGINVSMMLNNLAVENIALGIAAGFTGAKIIDTLNDEHIINRFVSQNEGNSRVNVKLLNYEGTELNGSGPKISSESFCALMAEIEKIKEGDILIISGSLPVNMKSADYEKIAQSVTHRGGKIIADTTGENLRVLLKYKPLLIKPNIDELQQFFDTVIVDDAQAEEYARRLQKLGAENVIVSMGGKGAILIDGDSAMIKRAVPRGTVINTVGAGDSMIAGFVDAYLRGESVATCFLESVACGSATAYSEGFASRERVEALMKDSE